MKKTYTYFETYDDYEWDENINELTHWYVRRYYDIPFWKVNWRWLVYWICLPIFAVLLLIPFFITHNPAMIGIEAVILLHFLFFTAVEDSIQDFCAKYIVATGEKQKVLDELEQHWAEEENKAKIWRDAHPLEEKCRLALTKNPNYVADLIRYVGEEYLPRD